MGLNNNNNKFQNEKFDIKLDGITKSDDDVNLITKNVPFTIVVKQKSNRNNNNIFKNLTKDKISLKLVYENDLENNVNTLKTSPLEYNIYIKDNQYVTVETRIHTLSSKHENNLFRIILVLDNKSLYTESIKCVSKITNTVINKDHNKELKENNSENNNSDNDSSNKKLESTIQSPVVKKTKTKSKSLQPLSLKNKINNNNISNIGQLSKTINKLKKLRQNDKNLISLLYQQNKLITSQLNSVTSIVNSLVVHHNNSKNNSSSVGGDNNNNNNNSVDNNNIVYKSSPSSHEAPYSPTTFSLPPSPSNSSPPTPFSCDDKNQQPQILQQHQQNTTTIPDFQFPTIDIEMLKSMSTTESCYSFPSDSSNQDFQLNNVQQQQKVMTNGSSASSEVRLIGTQLNFKTPGILQQTQQSLDNTYSHLNPNFTYDLDFNLLTAQDAYWC